MAKSTAAIVGGDTLIGRELNELLGDSGLAGEIRMISSDPGAARLVVDPGEEEAAVLAPLTAEALFGADAVFLAGTPESSRKALEMAGTHGPPTTTSSSFRRTPGDTIDQATIAVPGTNMSKNHWSAARR